MAAVPSISEHCSRVRTTNVDSAWSAASFVRDGIPRATHLDLVQLAGLMERTSGRPEISIALIDGPVATDHPDLAGTRIREVSDKTGGRCEHTESFACLHGTFVAAILSARRDSLAPAICPGCTLLIRPIFSEMIQVRGQIMPSATPNELAKAILECVDQGARVINLSAALGPNPRGERELEDALDYASRRGSLVVAAAGNQATLGSSAITRHPWVIPVVAYDRYGRPMNLSNFGSSIGKRGLGASGDEVTSVTHSGKPFVASGTSAAAPFVTGTAALLLSEFPSATAAEVRWALTQTPSARRMAVIPPLLNARIAYEAMQKSKC